MYYSAFFKNIIAVVALLLSFLVAFGQKEWSNWYANGEVMLTFKNGTAEKVTGFIKDIPPLPPYENIYHFAYWGDGGISYSDPITGEMMFAISKRLGFGRDFEDFPNDTLLRSCPDYKKSYQIIPIPDNPGKFYVMQFQSAAHDLAAQETGLQVRCPNAIGLGYSIVDMSKNGGLGDFTSMNNVLKSGLTDQITYVRHANGKDVWIIVHPYYTAEYHAILATANGFKSSVISTIGGLVNGGSGSVGGILESSHDGKLLAGYRTLPASFGRQYTDIELFDFDNATGKLSNYRTLPNQGPLTSMQFSPDNSKLYAITYLHNYSYQQLDQWDFNQPDLAASRTKLFEKKNGDMYDMQLGPDGKIYVNHYREYTEDDYYNFLMIIQCPNLPQYASNLKLKGIEINFPNFPDFINDFINAPKAIPPPKFSIGNDTGICFGTHTLTAPTGWESYQWSTGETTRQITIDKPGLYYVLTGNTGFSCPSGYGYINIADNAVKLDLGRDTGLCANTSFPLKIPNGYSNVLWNNGSNTRDSILYGGGQVVITANDPFGCFTSDTINVNQKYYPRAAFGNDTVLCNNDILFLRLEPTNVFGGNAVYKWKDNSTNETFNVTQPGTYWGTVSFDGCTVSDTIMVSYINSEQVTLGRDTTLCEGDSLLLSPSISGANYLWNTGETTSSIYAKNNGEYWVSVNNGTCTLRDSIRVTFNAKPFFTLGKDTALCKGNTLVLNPGLTGGNFLWQNGSISDKFTVTTGGNYWLSYTRNSCTVRDSIEVIYNDLPTLNLGNDTGFCAGNSFSLNAFNSAIKSYLWQNQSTASSFTATLGGIYHVTVTGQNGCINKDTIILSSIPLPVFNLGNDTSLCEGSTLDLINNLQGAIYTWSNGSNGNKISVTSSGNYWLKTDLKGCSYADTIKVDFKPYPMVTLGKDTTLCEGTSTLLNAANTNAAYYWQDGSNTPDYLVRQAGLFHVTVDLNGCIKKDSINIKYIPKPILSNISDTALCAGQFILLSPVTNTTVDYLWQNGSRTPVFQVTDSGRYSITVTNICGSAYQSITVKQGVCLLYLPTAFTPNNDNLNDVFRIKYPFLVKQFKMRIYNRFGNIVFETTSMDWGWNGTYKGQLAPSGNYIWDVFIEDNAGKIETLKGSVLLIK